MNLKKDGLDPDEWDGDTCKVNMARTYQCATEQHSVKGMTNCQPPFY